MDRIQAIMTRLPSWVKIGLPEIIISLIVLFLVLAFWFCISAKGDQDPSKHGAFHNYCLFAWSCFVKPHRGDSTRNQQDALESFYNAQASIYDATRMRLLQGRSEMLGLAVAQLKHRIDSGQLPQRPTWVDIGGGTGYNIEKMQSFVDVPTFFERVYVVDLSPSLCRVARERFARLGWDNVTVVCEDARLFALGDSEKRNGITSQEKGLKPTAMQAALITMSYSLSMIPEFYSVIDSLSTMLQTNGVISVADFYVQSEVDYQTRNYIGGEINRHCMWISRVFWRAWFEADRVNLEAARRDYLEYRFGTVLSVNERCHMFGLRIPYYVWIGCSKEVTSSRSKLAEVNAKATESPFLSALDLHQQNVDASHETSALDIRSKAYESAVLNLSSSLPLPASWYQAHHWRIFYEEGLQKHRQFGDEYIYAFTWEDARTDSRILKINEDDVILAITSGGDNVLAHALDGPKRIHAVDLNPNQNHILELKLACFTTLPYSDIWALFGEGKHPDFRSLLISKLSPHLSSLAFQYWLQHGEKTFSPRGKGFYATGGSGRALNLVRLLSRVLSLDSHITRLTSSETLNEQREIWQRGLRRVLLSKLLSWSIVSNKQWLWKALGVPSAQRNLIEKDYQRSEADLPLPPNTPKITTQERAIALAQKPSDLATSPDGAGAPISMAQYGSGRAVWNYAVNTLDPVVNNTLLSESNHYYLLCLLGHYTRKCHPEYLTPKAHAKLSKPNAFDGLRIHTDEVSEVVERMQPSSLTIAVLMDSLDWFEPHSTTDRARLSKQLDLLRQALRPGGRVMIRSAGVWPWYISVFEEKGFRSKRVNVRLPGTCVDRVNMYASTWILTKWEAGMKTPAQSPMQSPVSSPVMPMMSRSPGLEMRGSAAQRPGLRHTRTGSLEPLDIGMPAQPGS